MSVFHAPLRWMQRILGRPSEVPLGVQGERAASNYLKGLGYRILERGSRWKVGEIDLIALDDQTIVIVEVKTRRTDQRGSPAEAVGRDKQRRLSQAALAYLKSHGLLEQRARFDIISVIWPAGQERPTIRHCKNAFEPPGSGQFFG